MLIGVKNGLIEVKLGNTTFAYFLKCHCLQFFWCYFYSTFKVTDKINISYRSAPGTSLLCLIGMNTVMN